jgi:hypothetical protein
MIDYRSTTSSPEQCGVCSRCGYAIYIGLTHQCATAPAVPRNYPPFRDALPGCGQPGAAKEGEH